MSLPNSMLPDIVNRPRCFVNTLNQDWIAWNFNWIFITWIHSSLRSHMAWRLWKGKIPHVQMYFMYTLVLQSMSWQCSWIGVGIFRCHDKCIIYWQFTNQTAQFMNIARQDLMSSIIDSTTSWMIACQTCSSCDIYLTQVSIHKSSLLSHNWHETSLLSSLHTQIEPTPYAWSIQEKNCIWSREKSHPICLWNTVKQASVNAKRDKRGWSIANPAVAW